MLLEPFFQQPEGPRGPEQFFRVFPHDPGIEVEKIGLGGRDDDELIVDLTLNDLVFEGRFAGELPQLVGSSDTVGQYPDVTGILVNLEDAGNGLLCCQNFETGTPEAGLDERGTRRRHVHRLILSPGRYGGKRKNPRHED